MSEDIDRSVASLTKAQRECLRGQIAYRLYGVVVVRSGTTGTLKALDRKALLESAMLTKTGLAVRARLIEQSAAKGSAGE